MNLPLLCLVVLNLDTSPETLQSTEESKGLKLA